MTTDLVLDDVTLVRGGNTLIDGLDVVVAPGQTLAVTGASGAGKTTLLKAISGLSPCDRGSRHRPAVAGTETRAALQQRGVSRPAVSRHGAGRSGRDHHVEAVD